MPNQQTFFVSSHTQSVFLFLVNPAFYFRPDFLSRFLFLFRLLCSPLSFSFVYTSRVWFHHSFQFCFSVLSACKTFWFLFRTINLFFRFQLGLCCFSRSSKFSLCVLLVLSVSFAYWDFDLSNGTARHENWQAGFFNYKNRHATFEFWFFFTKICFVSVCTCVVHKRCHSSVVTTCPKMRVEVPKIFLK